GLRKRSNRSQRSENSARKIPASGIRAGRTDKKSRANPGSSRHKPQSGFFVAHSGSPPSSYFRLERTKKHQRCLKTRHLESCFWQGLLDWVPEANTLPRSHATTTVYYCNWCALSRRWRTGVDHFPAGRKSEIRCSLGRGDTRKRATALRESARGGEKRK